MNLPIFMNNTKTRKNMEMAMIYLDPCFGKINEEAVSEDPDGEIRR